ncbi:ACT domain-containing protein ACR1 [Hibiscus syriacus]|uniref:ACT domain-containing protein ACR n=1 Tax=Hibiscus syriacus TaxID=106335 RepID=A0A6A3ASH9_HIBSY|nr:ACT domain-containing protein ACR1 [Hibiscus syriacus]
MEILNQPYVDPEFESLVERINDPRVCIDNDTCSHCTVVKVDSANRHGILLEMVQVLTDLDLVISKSYICSDGVWLMDVFHVRDQLGKKITDETLTLCIQQELCDTRRRGGIQKDLQTCLKRNHASMEHTALEITGRDRPGLMSDISAALYELECHIIPAVAWTHNGRMACLIQLEDGVEGGPITVPKRLAQVQEKLESVTEAHHENVDEKTVRLTGLATDRIHTERWLHQLMYTDRDYKSCRGCTGNCRHQNECNNTHVTVGTCREKGYSVVNVRSRDRNKLLFDTVCAFTDMQYVIFHAAILELLLPSLRNSRRLPLVHHSVPVQKMDNNVIFEFHVKCCYVRDVVTGEMLLQGWHATYGTVASVCQTLDAVQSDWGGEYRSLSSVLLKDGIIHRVACPHTSEQNVFLINRLPTRVLNRLSPHENFWGKKPEYEFIKGLVVQVMLVCLVNRNLQHFNLGPIYGSFKPGVAPLKATVQQEVVDANANNVYGGSGDMGQATIDMGDTSLGVVVQQEEGGVTSVSATENDEIMVQVQLVAVFDSFDNVSPPLQITATRGGSDEGSLNRYSMLTRSKCGIFKPKLYLASYDDIEHVNVYEALQSSHWRVVVHAEFEALRKNEHDFGETFSLVVKFAMLNVVLSLDVTNGWQLRQVDVNNAFLHGDMHEEVFMQQPPGFKQVATDGSLLVLLTGDSSLQIEEVVRLLGIEFALKDLGDLHYFLGIKVKRCGGLLLQNAYEYRSIIGALIYECHTRPDIAFSVNKVVQYMHDPRQEHLVVVKRILRYLVGTINHGLVIAPAVVGFNVIAFTDVDWATNTDDRKSISGYCVFVGDNLVMWNSRKQKSVSRSTMEAEYKSVDDVTAETTWVSALLSDLGFARQKSTNCLVSLKQVVVNYVPDSHQVADGFTKPLAAARFEVFKAKDGCSLVSESESRKLTQCLITAIKRRVSLGSRVDISSENNMGLLWKVTRVFREKDLSISRMELGTHGEKASGCFYVTDASGNDADSGTVESVKQQIGGSVLAVHKSSWSSSTSEVEDRRCTFSLGNLLWSLLSI